jgi:hypothetical protein
LRFQAARISPEAEMAGKRTFDKSKSDMVFGRRQTGRTELKR